MDNFKKKNTRTYCDGAIIINNDVQSLPVFRVGVGHMGNVD